MNKPLRVLIILALVLAVPIVPFALWGELFTGWLADWRADPPSDGVLAAAVAGLLAADVLLPVPSSAVSTLAGAQLGALLGTLACWVGMTAGAVIAFVLARLWGRPLARRFASEEDLASMEEPAQRQDVALLLITRPLPVLAEACVLLVGVLGTPWRRFLPAVAVSNLAIAAVYAVLGQYAAEHQWLPVAVCLSLAVPVAVAFWARRRLARSPS